MKTMSTVTKALNLLKFFSPQRGEISLSEFKAITEQDKATIYRHLSALEAGGMLEQNPVSKSYRLGAGIMRLAAIREASFPLKSLAAPFIDELSSRVQELAHMSIYQDGVMCPVYYADLHNHGTRISFNMGEMLPLHATASGLSMLSFGNPNLLDKLSAQTLAACTPKTVMDHKTLTEMVNTTRAQGYSFCDQGFEIDVMSLAMPIFDHGQYAIGSVSVALPLSRMNTGMKESVITSLQETSTQITTSLGGTIPAPFQHLWNKAS